jgi:hypothetical protein
MATRASQEGYVDIDDLFIGHRSAPPSVAFRMTAEPADRRPPSESRRTGWRLSVRFRIFGPDGDRFANIWATVTTRRQMKEQSGTSAPVGKT